MQKSRSSVSATVGALAVIVASLLVLVGLEKFAVATAVGQRLDGSGMRTVSAGAHALDRLYNFLGIISIGTAAAALVVCVLLALLRGRIAVALGAVVLMAGANLSTQLLKKVYFHRPDLGQQDFGGGNLNSYPSGHTTVAVAAVLAALLVAPPLLRPVVVLAGSFAATLVGTSTVVGTWHRPSDVVGALAVCLLWGALVALAVGVLHRPHTDGLLGSCVLALVGAAAAGALLLAVGVRPTNGIAGLADASAILGALGVATGLAIGVFARLVPR